MITQSELTHDAQRATSLARFDADALSVEDGETFTRVDLVFSGVDHSDDSYEVRVFLNNPEAGADTARSRDQGYAGRFVVFGHGGCFGGIGHCDVPTGPRDHHDRRLPHPLTPETKLVTITEAVKHITQDGAPEQFDVTLVPVSKGAERAQRGPAPELFTFEGLELQIYLSEDDLPESDEALR